MKMELILYNYCNSLEGACFSRNFFPTGSPRVETVCASLADALPLPKLLQRLCYIHRYRKNLIEFMLH